MYAGKILNIATNQAVTTYGDVNGMTFFGMYKYKQDNSVSVGIYDKFEYGANLNWGDVIDDGSYVLGSHKVNHDITKDGFYSNYINAETTKMIWIILNQLQKMQLCTCGSLENR